MPFQLSVTHTGSSGLIAIIPTRTGFITEHEQAAHEAHRWSHYNPMQLKPAKQWEHPRSPQPCDPARFQLVPQKSEASCREPQTREAPNLRGRSAKATSQHGLPKDRCGLRELRQFFFGSRESIRLWDEAFLPTSHRCMQCLDTAETKDPSSAPVSVIDESHTCEAKGEM